MKVALRFELRMGALQAPALPLGYATERLGIMLDWIDCRQWNYQVTV